MKPLLLLLPLAFLAACDHECDKLAQATCERVGENTRECELIRKRADEASHDDRRACGQALTVTRRLTPTN